MGRPPCCAAAAEAAHGGACLPSIADSGHKRQLQCRTEQANEKCSQHTISMQMCCLVRQREPRPAKPCWTAVLAAEH